MLLIIGIFTALILALMLLTTLPMKFTGFDKNPERLIEGRVVGLQLFVKTTTFFDNKRKHISEGKTKISVNERIRLTFALLNPSFDAACLESLITKPNEIIAQKGSTSPKTWKEIYAECDLDNDGILTRRDYTNWLIKEAMPWNIGR